jgi:aromatase
MTSSVTGARTVASTHTAFVAAPPRAVFRLIAEATLWPYLFPAIVHVERLAGGVAEERLRLWTVNNGAVGNWVSRRSLDREGLRIRFRQESPLPPVASMSGEWVFVPLPGNATSVVLLHEFQAIDDDPAGTMLIKQAVDRNSTAELSALRSTAELGDRLATLVHSFSETVTIDAPLEPVYDFLHRAGEWPRQLPHVSRLVVDEAVPNVQTIEMDTGDAEGRPLTTEMVRVCFPYHTIVYKQTRPPETMATHVGRWQLHPTAEGLRVTAHNTVLMRPGRDDPRRPEVREQVGEAIRQGLRRNCLATLLRAKETTEGTVPPEGERAETVR